MFGVDLMHLVTGLLYLYLHNVFFLICSVICILTKCFFILETQRPPSKRRKRKSSAANSGVASTGGKKKNLSPGPPNFTLASQVCDFSRRNF